VVEERVGLRAVAGIQARLGSTRLPGKVLADLAGRPLIQRVYERALGATRLEGVFVLTSEEASDDPLVDELERRAIPVRRGPLEDVLARYGALIEECRPRYVVRITGDSPLVEPEFIDSQLAALEAFDADFAWVAPGAEGTLAGQSAISARALLQALPSTDPLDREHVASFFFQNHHERFRHVEVVVDDALRRPGLRLAVDEEADLALVRRIYEHFGPRFGSRFPLRDVLAWLDAHPEVGELNRRVQESGPNQRLSGMKRAARIRTVGRWP
jgi:spore coat polysaccharide biosynthesis protein SpsF